MRRRTTTVFNDFVVGTTATYTDARFNSDLGSEDKLAIQLIVDQVTGTSPAVSLQIEHSGDGRNWSNKAVAAELPSSNGTLSGAQTFTFFVSDVGTTPSLGFVRFRIALNGTAPVAHIVVQVSGRDNSG